MGFVELFLIAVSLSMDAFAVSISLGLSRGKATIGDALTAGLYFGLFQAGMPLIGYLAASLFADKVTVLAPWIAFILLALIGGHMIAESLEKEEDSDEKDGALTPAKMLPLAVATSIDALAVGVSFAFLKVSIVPAALLICATTFAFSVAGVRIGSSIGAKFKAKAEFVGGVILILLGLKILLEHLGVLRF